MTRLISVTEKSPSTKKKNIKKKNSGFGYFLTKLTLAALRFQSGVLLNQSKTRQQKSNSLQQNIWQVWLSLFRYETESSYWPVYVENKLQTDLLSAFSLDMLQSNLNAHQKAYYQSLTKAYTFPHWKYI